MSLDGIPILLRHILFLQDQHHGRYVHTSILYEIIRVYVSSHSVHSRTGRDETKRKTQERMERRSRKRSSSAGSGKMERVGDRTEWRDIVR